MTDGTPTVENESLLDARYAFRTLSVLRLAATPGSERSGRYPACQRRREFHESNTDRDPRHLVRRRTAWRTRVHGNWTGGSQGAGAEIKEDGHRCQIQGSLWDDLLGCRCEEVSLYLPDGSQT